MSIRSGNTALSFPWLNVGRRWLVVGLLALGLSASAEAEVRRGLQPTPGDGDGARLVAILDDDNRLYLEAQPLAGEGLLAMARRLCGTEEAAAEIRSAGKKPRRLLAGLWYRVGFDHLSTAFRLRVVTALFPDDGPTVEGWRHRVTALPDAPAETLWRVAERFTGAGQRYPSIRTHNRLSDNSIYRGQWLTVPRAELLPAFRGLLPPALPVLPREVTVSAVPAPAPGEAGEPERAAAVEEPVVVPAVTAAGGDPRLRFAKDEDGEHAVYRLKPGEALYSSVVVRFTGRVYAADVNALAATIAERSGIDDVTDIDIGFPVKIPLELVQPEFLPAGHPRRQEYEAGRLASAQFSNTVRSRDLAGITVILDAGHGGKDTGASTRGVWESIYVYDIMVRLKAYLEKYTSAEVYTTTRDGGAYRIPDRDVLPFNRSHRVLTTPPYSLTQDTKVGVNLRWYLANSLFRKAVKKGRGSEKVVFISIHADSLHPSLRGAMAYIPDAYLRKGSYRKTGIAYTSRKEVQEKPQVSYSWRQRARSEGLSRQLADQIIAAFQADALVVHPEKPVRQKIYRGRRPWVPAVLRYNAVPAGVLLEVCNLANDEDRALLTTRRFRQQAAEAIASGLLRYYGVSGARKGTQVARSAD